MPTKKSAVRVDAFSGNYSQLVGSRGNQNNGKKIGNGKTCGKCKMVRLFLLEISSTLPGPHLLIWLVGGGVI